MKIENWIIKISLFSLNSLILFGILITLFLWFMIPGDDMYEKQLRAIVMRQFIQLTISLICIKRNEKMFLFCKHQFFIHFCGRTDIIVDLNVVTEACENLDQNEDDSYQGGSSTTASVQINNSTTNILV